MMPRAKHAVQVRLDERSINRHTAILAAPPFEHRVNEPAETPSHIEQKILEQRVTQRIQRLVNLRHEYMPLTRQDRREIVMVDENPRRTFRHESVIGLQTREVEIGNMPVVCNAVAVLLQKFRSRLRRQQMQLCVQRTLPPAEARSNQIERGRLVFFPLLWIPGNKRDRN